MALAAALAVLVAGCGNSADPDTWQEAEEAAFTHSDSNVTYDSAVEGNFVESCILSNEESTGGNLTASKARVLCGCSFDGLRASFTFQEFKSLDRALRDDPNPSDLDEEPEDLWDDVAEEILASCARKVDA